MKSPLFLTVLLLGVVLAGNLPAQSPVALPFAVTRDDVDTANCKTIRNGNVTAPDVDLMLHSMGLFPKYEHAWKRWSAGRVMEESKKAEIFHYLVAFKKPVTIGSVLLTNHKFAYLKADAPFPPDPAKPEQWVTFDLRGGNAPRFCVLPKPVETRAVLFTDVIASAYVDSICSPVRFFKERVFNAAPLAGARAKSEYAAPVNFGAVVHRAINVVRGQGDWASNGANQEGNVVGAFISDIQPQWFVMAWDEPRTLVGLFMQDNFGDVKFDVFSGDAGVNPLAGVSSEWTPLKQKQFSMMQQQGRWVLFAEPIKTRGVRIRILKALTAKGEASHVARLDSIMALEHLGTAAEPVVMTDPPPPPITVPYTLAQDGLFTMAIDNGDGQRVRNLVARVERKAGPNKEVWDLIDENGKLVPVGVYPWKAITAPPLELRYEMTAYPNVTVHHPENTAWLNGPAGPGGWLADHSPPRSACASDDALFFGAPTAESGVGFIACDLTGKKLWGIHSFAAWSAGNSIATDGKTVFVQQGGFGAYGSPDEGADRVWGVDIASHEWKPVYIAQNNEKRRRGVSGMAARDGKVYLAVNGVDNWLANAIGWDVVDVTKCLPFYKEARKPKIPYEIVPDPRNDFLRLFRLKGTPPGCYALTYLLSTLGAGKREHIMLAFNKPVDIGSCVFPAGATKDYQVKLSVARPDAPYPPNPRKKDQWLDFEKQVDLAWDVALAPSNTTTRALLVTFFKGDEDELSDVLEDSEDASVSAEPSIDLLKDDEPPDALGKKENWRGSLEGMKILRRRYQNVFKTATVSVNSGVVDKDGVWDAKRTAPLTRENPGIYLLTWPAPQSIRGLAIREIDGKTTEIDAYVGPADKPVDMNSAEGWEKLASYEQARRDHHTGFESANLEARFMDGYVDFGKEVKTRALRLRVVEPWVDNGAGGSLGVRKDQGGTTIDATRCRIYGVAPLQYVGGESAVDPLVAERIEVVNAASGKVEREVGIRKPGALAFAPDGTLYGVTEGKVVAIDLAGGRHKPVITDVKTPTTIACDRKGGIYVFDAAPEQRVIRVYDAAGKFLRLIGEPGGYVVGPWNPNRFQAISAIAIDRENKLWAVDETYWPKRISCWTLEGQFQRETMGPTCYGGAGVLDPADTTRLFYGPLEFEIDWATGKSRLKNLTWNPEDGWAAGEMPVRVNNRVYLVNRPGDSMMTMRCGIVYLYEKDHLRRVAAVGHADAFAALQNKEVLQGLGTRPLKDLQFTWSDRNGDGNPQFGECDFQPKHVPALTRFNNNLEVQAGAYRYEVKEFLANGAPVYVEKKTVQAFAGGYADGTLYRLASGNYYQVGAGKDQPESCFTPEGKLLWTYKSEGAGVGPDRSCRPYTPDQVVCEFTITGHEVAPAGDLGEFYVINANLGSWYIWTADGLLAGRLFRDLRDPLRVSWTMKEHERGMRLDDVTAGQEHFQGWFCRSTKDGKYYAVAGHNHASVVEVGGIEKFKRMNGSLTITAADVAKACEWQKEIIKFKAKENAKVVDCYSVESTGKNWENVPVSRMETADAGRSIALQVCHDKANLYLRYEVRGAGPFKNTGNQWDRLFKTGACVDLMLGLKPDADPGRRAPVEGDKRLLIAPLNEKPIAVLYDAVAPNAPKDQKWEAVSPVARTDFDSVRQVKEAGIEFQNILSWAQQPKDQKIIGYILDVNIPLASLGLVIEPDMRIRLDWGILETDKEGAAVLSRTYWSNKTTSTLADAPSEARLEPDLWGWAVFPGRNKEAPTMDLDSDKGSIDDLKLDEE